MIGEHQFCCYKCAGIAFTIHIPSTEEGYDPGDPPRKNGHIIDHILTCLNPTCGQKLTVTHYAATVEGTLSESD